MWLVLMCLFTSRNATKSINCLFKQQIVKQSLQNRLVFNLKCYHVHQASQHLPLIFFSVKK